MGNSWSLWYPSTSDCSACAPCTHSSGICRVTHWMQYVKPRARVPCLGNRMDEHLVPPCLLFLSLISKSQDHCFPITALHKWLRLSILVLKISFCNCSCNLFKQALLPKGMRATSFYSLLPRSLMEPWNSHTAHLMQGSPSRKTRASFHKDWLPTPGIMILYKHSSHDIHGTNPHHFQLCAF